MKAAGQGRGGSSRRLDGHLGTAVRFGGIWHLASGFWFLVCCVAEKMDNNHIALNAWNTSRPLFNLGGNAVSNASTSPTT